MIYSTTYKIFSSIVAWAELQAAAQKAAAEKVGVFLFVFLCVCAHRPNLFQWRPNTHVCKCPRIFVVPHISLHACQVTFDFLISHHDSLCVMRILLFTTCLGTARYRYARASISFCDLV